MVVQEILCGTIPNGHREGNSLEFLRTLLQLSPRNEPLSLTRQDSVVFVAIDFEFSAYCPSKNRQARINEIGISTFDTRDSCGPPSDAIHSQNHTWHANKYSRRKFLFNESKKIFPYEMRKLLEENIFLKDTDGTFRRTVLVGHDLSSELDLMQSIGIDLMDKVLSSSFLGILDTKILGSAVIGGDYMSLKNLLATLEIPFAHLHIAGNDANFTLKALLVLVVRSMEGTELSPEQEELLAQLRAVGHSPIDAELAGRTPDEELHHQRMLEKEDEKRMRRLEIKDADVLDHFPSFAELEIGD